MVHVNVLEFSCTELQSEKIFDVPAALKRMHRGQKCVREAEQKANALLFPFFHSCLCLSLCPRYSSSNSFIKDFFLFLFFIKSLRAFILIRGPSAFNETSYFYSELLAHLNSLLNPLVYVICHKHYRSSIKDLFKSCHCSGGFRIIKRAKFFLKGEDVSSEKNLFFLLFFRSLIGLGGLCS